jgi:hypothetical protein
LSRRSQTSRTALASVFSAYMIDITPTFPPKEVHKPGMAPATVVAVVSRLLKVLLSFRG